VIIAKVPLRITLGGGGTDLPGFYQKHGGFWITAAIDKYIYVIVKDRFESNLRVAYSELEFASKPEEIGHGVVREALKAFNIQSHFEIISIGDLPARTGLGSSGAFTVALLGALNKYRGTQDKTLPETAYNLERASLNRMTGRQDHYAAYFGGVRAYTLTPEDKISYEVLNDYALQDHLSLFYTGKTRGSEPILEEVDKAEAAMLKIKELGHESYEALVDMNYKRLGELLNTHWTLKRGITDKMSGSYIDKCYSHALENGATGGKLVGAGGGGFLMFCSQTKEERDTLVKSLDNHLVHVPFKIHNRGLEVKQI